LPVGETGTGLAMGGRGNVSVSAFLFSAHQRGIASAWGASAGSATLADQTLVDPREPSSTLLETRRPSSTPPCPCQTGPSPDAGRPLSGGPAAILWSGRLPRPGRIHQPSPRYAARRRVLQQLSWTRKSLGRDRQGDGVEKRAPRPRAPKPLRPL
jgi:hypothetical protein